jgi:hypothetical protein
MRQSRTALALASVWRATTERIPRWIEFGALGAQAYFDVPKALPIGQLREGHAFLINNLRKLRGKTLGHY